MTSCIKFSVVFDGNKQIINFHPWLQPTIKKKLISEMEGRTELSASNIYVIILLLLQSALQPLGGFRPAQLSLSILSRKVLLSAVDRGTSNPQLGGEPGI
jgi:hypothetical protein